MMASLAPRRHPKDVSASAVGQWIHDHVEVDFDHVDIDFWHYAISTNTFRLFEEKKPGQDLKPSQIRGLTLFAGWIESAVRHGELSGGGVYVLWFDQKKGRVKGLRRLNRRGELSGLLLPDGMESPESLIDFFRCRLILAQCITAWPGKQRCAECSATLPSIESWDYPFQSLKDGTRLCIPCWRQHNNISEISTSQTLTRALRKTLGVGDALNGAA